MTKYVRVMISSTVRDLPKHREKVMHACMRMGMFYPEMMEHLSAEDATAIEVSLRMVDQADLYLGIIGRRYGYVPPGSDISVTEIEYNRAAERRIPRLMFLMHREHRMRKVDIEVGENETKLRTFIERVKNERVVGFYKSADELLALVIQSLALHRHRNLTEFHSVSEIPALPDPYTAHPYTLLQTDRLLGREFELTQLTQWMEGKDFAHGSVQAAANTVRIMALIAIGGMGKSALSWTWYKHLAPKLITPGSGQMWWSFYESDATFENFIIRALAYVAQLPLNKVLQISASDRENRLLSTLDRQPFLIVLDGLERTLIAYSSGDTSRTLDHCIRDQKSFRKTTNPNVGRFLKKLTCINRSRILITSRLYPAELETDAGDPLRGCFRLDMTGLLDEDAVEMWRACGVTGSQRELLRVFTTFGKHPLLIQSLAGEIRRYRRAPGSFAIWLKATPQFRPWDFPELHEAMGHVLEFPLKGLSEVGLKVLKIIAAFRMPARYETLAALLVGKGKPCANEYELDHILSELEDRTLIGWNIKANRYDMHPIVRGVVWGSLNRSSQTALYRQLSKYFESLPPVNESDVNSVDDITATIELYHSLIGMRRYEDALNLFKGRIGIVALYRLGASRLTVDLLERLFLEGLTQSPSLKTVDGRSYTLNALAHALCLVGEPKRAIPLYQLSISSTQPNVAGELGLRVTKTLCNLSAALLSSGSLYEAELNARKALKIPRRRHNRFWEAVSLRYLGRVLADRGFLKVSGSALRQSLLKIETQNSKKTIQAEGVAHAYVAEWMLWSGDPQSSLRSARRAWELAQAESYVRDFVHVARLVGEAELMLGNFKQAEERLHYALTQARSVSFVEEELATLIVLAELKRRQGELRSAREFLEDVWDPVQRGSYVLIYADAFNCLARIEHDEGNGNRAIDAAGNAYRLAWCDGPPFAYQRGLKAAKEQLDKLSTPAPQMPVFDQSKFDIMSPVDVGLE